MILTGTDAKKNGLPMDRRANRQIDELTNRRTHRPIDRLTDRPTDRHPLIEMRGRIGFVMHDSQDV